MSTLDAYRVIGCIALLGVATGCSNGAGDPPPESATLDPIVRIAADDASKPQPAARDACGLITKAEAEAILHASVTPKSERKAGWAVCDYQPSAGPGGSGFTLKVFWSGGREELTVTKSVMQVAPQTMRENGMEPGGMMVLEPVERLGEEAYFNPVVGSYVRQGDALMEFDLRLLLFHAPSKEAAMAQWRELAQKALGRL